MASGQTIERAALEIGQDAARRLRCLCLGNAEVHVGKKVTRLAPLFALPTTREEYTQALRDGAQLLSADFAICEVEKASGLSGEEAAAVVEEILPEVFADYWYEMFKPAEAAEVSCPVADRPLQQGDCCPLCRENGRDGYLIRDGQFLTCSNAGLANGFCFFEERTKLYSVGAADDPRPVYEPAEPGYAWDLAFAGGGE